MDNYKIKGMLKSLNRSEKSLPLIAVGHKKKISMENKGNKENGMNRIKYNL